MARARFLVAATAAIAAVLWPHPLLAQRLNFSQYTTAEGLPDRHVVDVMQDREGFIWVATEGGLARYDGNGFRTFSRSEGLADNVITAIAQTPDGRIVVGTARGLSVLEGSIVRRLAPIPAIADRPIRDLAASDQGVWVLTSAELVHLVIGNAEIRSTRVEAVEARALLVAVPGGAWVAGNGFVREILPGGLGPPIPGVHSTVQVFDMVADEKGAPWLATNAGIFRLGAGGFEKQTGGDLDGRRSLRAVAAARSEEGQLWFGTWGGLLALADGEARLLREPDGLPEAAVSAVAVDRDGTIWIGMEGGLAKLVPGPFSTFTEAHGLPSDNVVAVTQDTDGRLWLATDRGVGVMADGGIDTPRQFDPARAAGPSSLAVDGEGRMLVGTEQGLFVDDGTRVRHFRRGAGLPASRVTALATDGAGGVWIGLAPGLARWRGGRMVRLDWLHDPSNLEVRALLADGATLWVATVSDGLRRFDASSGAEAPVPESLGDATVLTLSEGADGVVWAGLSGGGAIRIDREEVRRITRAQGLVDDFVHQIATDGEGRVWLYTNRGLDRLEKDGSIRHFGTGNGLVSLDGATGAVLVDRDGRLWFGTPGGVTVYDAAGEHRAVAPPAAAVVAAHADGDPIPLNGSTRLPSHRDALTFEFAALTFRNEASNRFRYRLAGLETEWSEPTRLHRISYGGLGPGDYRFEVLAVGSDGEAGAVPATVEFTVLPAFHETWWFRGLAVAALGLLGYSLYRARARRLVRDRDRLSRLVQERSGELARQQLTSESLEAASRAKSEFLAKTSHEIRTPINGVLGMAELLMFTPLTPRQRHLARTIHQSGQSLLDLINDILDVSKIEAGKLELESTEFELVDTVSQILDILAEKARAKSIALQCTIDPFTVPDLIGDPVRLRQVLLNLLDNAIKFTEEGHVRLLVDPLDSRDGEVRIRFRVEDTGVGIPEAAQRRIFEAFEQADASTTRTYGGTGLGLNIARQLVEAMGGELRLSSSAGEGTTFWFAATFRAQSAFQPRDTFHGASMLLLGFEGREVTALRRALGAWDCDVQWDGDEPRPSGESLQRRIVGCDVVIARAHCDRETLSWLRALRTATEEGPPVLLVVSPGDSLLEIERAVGTRCRLAHAPVGPRRLYAGLHEAMHGDGGADAGAIPAGTVEARFSGHVLLAEDNPVNKEITTGMLEAAGCTWVHARHGGEAAELFASGDFDLVLMDCEMPHVDGFEAVRRIRRFEAENHRPRTPVVAITASLVDEVRRRCHEVGMDGFLGKPHSMAELVQMLSRWLQTRSGEVVEELPGTAGAAAADAESLDPGALEQIRALQKPGEPSLLSRIIDSYLENAAETRATIHTAVQYGDAEALRTAAHGLKAASGNVGARRAMELCRRLERIGRDGALGGVEPVLDELDAELEIVSDLLRGESRSAANG